MMLSSARIRRRLLAAVGRRVTGTMTHLSTGEAVAALTFDDGPHPEYTPQLLDVLQRYRAHATFFMVGKSAQLHPEVVQQVARAGHAIGNHSWDHPSFPLISGRERREQVRACAAALYPYGQRLFRPPYGHQGLASRLDALWLGYQVVTWNTVASDWLNQEPGWMAEQMVEQIRPGSVILLHDALYTTLDEACCDRRPMLEALGLFLARLGDRFHFVTVPELRRFGRFRLDNWYRKPDIAFLNRLKRPDEGPARRYPMPKRTPRFCGKETS